MTIDTAAKPRNRMLAASVVLLCAVLIPFLWLYLTRSHFPIYWFRVAYPYFSCVTGLLSASLLAWVLSSSVPRQSLIAAVLLLAGPGAAWAWFVGWWTAPDHQASVVFENHTYYLAVDPLHDVSNLYYIYSCDRFGIICTEAYMRGYDHEPGTRLDLSIDPKERTLQVLYSDGRVANTFELP